LNVLEGNEGLKKPGQAAPGLVQQNQHITSYNTNAHLDIQEQRRRLPIFSYSNLIIKKKDNRFFILLKNIRF
jgi:hypothetical protein